MDQYRIVIHEQDPQAREHGRRQRHRHRLRTRRFGEPQTHRRAEANGAFDADLGAVPLHHSVDHREPETRAAFALGREERLEASALRVLVHADAGIADFDFHVTAGERAGAHREGAALGHRIDGIEHEIGQRLADFTLRSHDDRKVARELRFQVDDDSALLRHVAPARARQLDHLTDQIVEVHRRELHLRFARPIELAHAHHRRGHIVDRTLDDLQVPAALRAQGRFPCQQRFGVQGNRRDRVVDVVGDAARHLAERAQALLPQHGLLGLAKILVRVLQRAVELHVMCRERHVLGQLQQEVALAGAEACQLMPRRDQDAENLSLDEQRRGHHRPQSALREPLREQRWLLDGVGRVDQFPAGGACQAVLADVHARVLGERKLPREVLAADSDAVDREFVGRRVIKTEAGEIDRKLIFQRADDDLDDARQILALGDGTRDVMHEVHALELRGQLALGSLAIGDVVEQDGDVAGLGIADTVGVYLEVSPQWLRLVLEADRLASHRHLAEAI
jgi:hypothetical protein